MTAEDRERIRAEVAGWPPLTPEQKDRISLIAATTTAPDEAA